MVNDQEGEGSTGTDKSGSVAPEASASTTSLRHRLCQHFHRFFHPPQETEEEYDNRQY